MGEALGVAPGDSVAVGEAVPEGVVVGEGSGIITHSEFVPSPLKSALHM